MKKGFAYSSILKDNDDELMGTKPTRSNSSLSLPENEPAIKQVNSKRMVLIVVGVIFLLIAVFKFNTLSHWFSSAIEEIRHLSEPLRSIVFLVCLVMYQLFFIPSQVSFIILMAYALQSFVQSSFILVLSVTISGTINYVVVTRYLMEYLEEKYKDNVLYRVVKREAKEKPHQVNIMLRFMFVPAALKNSMLVLCGIDYISYIVWYQISMLTIGNLYILIGVNLGNSD